MRFSVYQESHIGGRKSNQDRMGYSFTRDSLLMVLADGMGGHILGDVAATLTVQAIGAMFQAQAKPYLKKPERFFEESFQAAHMEIHRYRATHNLPETPRTTIVACIVQHGTAIWAHCGDSRLYWMRKGQVLARTRDHSRIETLIAQGKVDPSERDTHPDRNRLFNCLGAPNMPLVEASRRATLQAGDLMLLCSDGLWSTLPDHLIAHELDSNTIMRAVPQLVRTATEIAGKKSDNVTALAMMWQGTDTEEAATGFTTNILPPGTLTTTIQAPRQAELEAAETFTDTDIEKAIEEIREAIDKSSRLTSKD
jgi:serine/threonine protein phosphatase PrpC